MLASNFSIILRIIRECSQTTSVENAFNECPESEKKALIKMMTICMNAEKQRKKTEQLVAFSTNQRSTSRMEWQTLDIED